MTLRRFFDHVIAGWFNGPARRSLNELGLGVSSGLLASMLLKEHRSLSLAFLVATAVWAGFYLSAFWIALKRLSVKGDQEYARKGKFRLAREYWNSESVTARRKKP